MEGKEEERVEEKEEEKDTSVQDELNEMLGDAPSGKGDEESEKREDLEEEKEEEKEEDKREEREERGKGETEFEKKEEEKEEKKEEKEDETDSERTLREAKETIDALRAKVNELQEGGKETPSKDHVSKEVEEKPSKPEEVAAPITIPSPEELASFELADFLPPDTTFQDVIDDPRLFKAAMQNMVSQLIEYSQKIMFPSFVNQAAETTLKAVPKTAQKVYNQHKALVETSEAFYAKNKDLVPFKKTVAGALTEVAADHPEYTIDQALTEAGKKAREALGLKEQAMEKETEESQESKSQEKPTFPKAKGNQRSSQAPKLTGLQKEMSETLKI
jgi:hypothetical protein